MKVLFILIFPVPLLNGLFSNTSTCQCTCHNQHLGEPGDNDTYRLNSPAPLTDRKVFMDDYFINIYGSVSVGTYRGKNLYSSIYPEPPERPKGFGIIH